MLYSIYPPLFAVLLAYSLGGTAISVYLGRVSAAVRAGLSFLQEKEADPFGLNFLQDEDKDADLRYGLVRARENELVALNFLQEKKELDYSASWNTHILILPLLSLPTLLSCLRPQELVALNFLQEKKEADFRYGLVRARENAESIAFYGGERSETRLLLQRFRQSFANYSVSERIGVLAVAVKCVQGHALNRLMTRLLLQLFRQSFANYSRLLVVGRNLDFFTSNYRYLIQLLPAAVVAPLYFRGEIEFGVINQSFSAFNHVLGDFSIIVFQFQALSQFSATVERLGAWEEGWMGKEGRMWSSRKDDLTRKTCCWPFDWWKDHAPHVHATHMWFFLRSHYLLTLSPPLSARPWMTRSSQPCYQLPLLREFQEVLDDQSKPAALPASSAASPAPTAGTADSQSPATDSAAPVAAGGKLVVSSKGEKLEGRPQATAAEAAAEHLASLFNSFITIENVILPASSPFLPPALLPASASSSSSSASPRVLLEVDALTLCTPHEENTAGECSEENTAGECSEENTAGECSKENTAGECSEENTAGECSEENTAGECSEENTAGECSEENTAGECSEENTAGECSMENTAGECSEENTAGECSEENTADLLFPPSPHQSKPSLLSPLPPDNGSQWQRQDISAPPLSSTPFPATYALFSRHLFSSPQIIVAGLLLPTMGPSGNHGSQRMNKCFETSQNAAPPSSPPLPSRPSQIMGPSGSGKTSLLRAVAGLWRSGSGTVRRYVYLPEGSAASTESKAAPPSSNTHSNTSAVINDSAHSKNDYNENDGEGSGSGARGKTEEAEGQKSEGEVSVERRESESEASVSVSVEGASVVKAEGAVADVEDGVMDAGGAVFFVPQRPYMVLGSLRQQLLYPTWSELEEGEGTGRADDGRVVVAQREGGEGSEGKEEREGSMEGWWTVGGLMQRLGIKKDADNGGTGERQGTCLDSLPPPFPLSPHHPTTWRTAGSLKRLTSAFLLPFHLFPAPLSPSLSHLPPAGFPPTSISTLASSPHNMAHRPQPSDEELLAVLDGVRLHHVAERQGGLDAQVEWASVLSLGEQQRLAFARLLLSRPELALMDESTSALDEENERRAGGVGECAVAGQAAAPCLFRPLLSHPELALMDESTSALDEENEAHVYGLVEAAGVTFISIGHRSFLHLSCVCMVVFILIPSPSLSLPSHRRMCACVRSGGSSRSDVHQHRPPQLPPSLMCVYGGFHSHTVPITFSPLPQPHVYGLVEAAGVTFISIGHRSFLHLSCVCMVAHVYGLVEAAGVTFISIGHRSSLRRFHSLLLTLTPAGRADAATANVTDDITDRSDGISSGGEGVEGKRVVARGTGSMWTLERIAD
ncbi:unnamed protein product [Closterium sp. NIES-64]|nr:unnamed protein product [Closterium sp. NIES-64]